MNKKLMFGLGLVLSASIFVACGSKQVEEVDLKETEEVEKIKIEDKNIDFSKVEYILSESEPLEVLEKLIKDELDYKEEDGEIRYFYNQVNLNQTEEDRIFVYLVGQAVSGSGGSTALLVNMDTEKVESRYTLVNNPIILSDGETNGFKDIIIPMFGGGMEAGYAVLKYNGESYPENINEAEEILGEEVKGLGIISDKIDGENGIKLK